MKISDIREYILLAHTKNFTRAAEELYIAQSALSRHISALETELGVKLIDRGHNHFRLTPAGETTLKQFESIMEDYNELLAKLSEQDRETEGSMDLGVLYYDRDSYVYKICKRFHERSPKVHVTLHSKQPGELEQELFSGAVDAVIVYGAALCGRTDVEVMPFLKIPYCLIYSTSHPFATMDSISPKDLSEQTLLVPREPFALNMGDRVLRRICSENGINFKSTAPIDNYDEVPWILEETGGVYLSPMANPHAYGPSTAYRDFMPERYSCDVSLVWLKSNDNPTIPLLGKAIRSCYP
ncbi:MAG: LysR family transcriptional regulator [Tractidigestivibacter sp.]|uniref:LysR family transcriptional regulator n=1 Tax=Tractidigestivibacter sp. TaxID=2847320 RepID=UPI003D9276EA